MSWQFHTHSTYMGASGRKRNCKRVCLLSTYLFWEEKIYCIPGSARESVALAVKKPN